MAKAGAGQLPLVKLLANLGYGSRSDMEKAIKFGQVTVDGVTINKPRQKVSADQDIRYLGEKLDPAFGMVVMLNKPAGYICSRDDMGLSYQALLPERFAYRNPALSPVGRLDKDTTGLLLLTDDGDLLHRLIAPKFHVEKCYVADLAEKLKGTEADLFASGELMLKSETSPLKPAKLAAVEDKQAELILTEGRYHQVKRMFAATGNKVTKLHRKSVGFLELGDLEEGSYRILSIEEVLKLREAVGL